MKNTDRTLAKHRYDRRATSGLGGLGGSHSGNRVQRIVPVIRYQATPTHPTYKPASIPACRICGHIFLKALLLDETGACRGKVNCANRAKGDTL